MADGKRNRVTVILAVVAIVLAGWLLVRSLTSEPPRDSVEYLSTELTIRCDDTGEEWEMNRGMLERELYTRPGVLDPNQGLTNPKTGKPTGFPASRAKDWDQVIARINAEKEQMRQSRDK